MPATKPSSYHNRSTKPYSPGAQCYGGCRGNLQNDQIMRLKIYCVSTSSTWRSWLGRFFSGWDFSKQERVLALWLGAAEGSIAKVVYLGFVFPADIVVSPELLHFFLKISFEAQKQKQKQNPKKTKPTVCFLKICFFWASSLSFALPLPTFVPHLFLFLLFHPPRFPIPLNYVLILF